MDAPDTLTASLRVASVDRAFGQRVDGALPRARMVPTAVVSVSPVSDIARIDPRTMALVGEDVRLGGGVPGEAVLARDDPGDVAIRTRASTRPR